MLRLDELASQAALNVFRGEPADAIDPSLVQVTVWNGTGEPGQAGEAEAALEREGFEVPDIDDAPDAEQETVVRHAPGMAPAAVLVARYLSSGAVVEEDEQLSDGEVVLVTGADFGEVLDEPSAEPPRTTTTEASGSESESGSVTGSGSGSSPGATTSTTFGVMPVEVAPDGC